MLKLSRVTVKKRLADAVRQYRDASTNEERGVIVRTIRELQEHRRQQLRGNHTKTQTK